MFKLICRIAHAVMVVAKSVENAANAYATTGKMENYPDACFHQKLRRLTTAQ